MDWYSLTNQKVEERIGDLIQNTRLRQNLTQSGLATKCGLSRVSISKIERGKGATLSSIIQIMRALNILQNVESLFPKEEMSPLELIKLQGKKRKRASGIKG